MRRALGPTLNPILGDFMGMQGGDMYGPFPPQKPWTDGDIMNQMTRLTMDRAQQLVGQEKTAADLYPALMAKDALAFCDLPDEEAEALVEEQKRQYIEDGMDPDAVELNQYADLIG